jgi:hypothetical protein
VDSESGCILLKCKSYSFFETDSGASDCDQVQIKNLGELRTPKVVFLAKKREKSQHLHKRKALSLSGSEGTTMNKCAS